MDVAQRRREYYKNNKEKVLNKVHEYYKNNREKALNQKKEYYTKNIETIKDKMKAYRTKNGKNLYANRKEWCKEYNLKNKERISEYHRTKNRAIKTTVLLHYSICRTVAMCSSPGCLITDLDMLCIDHINDDGQAHRKEVGPGSKIYSWLIKNGFPDGFQVLCANHNLKKQIQSHVKDKCIGDKAA